MPSDSEWKRHLNYHCLPPETRSSILELPLKMTQATLSEEQQDEDELEGIAGLPDVPLLHVMSYLSAVDLVAVARVCRRWGALASSTTLWRRERHVICSSPTTLTGVLRIVPNWDSLALEMQRQEAEIVACFKDGLCKVSVKSARVALQVLASELCRGATRLSFWEVLPRWCTRPERDVEVTGSKSSSTSSCRSSPFASDGECAALWTSLTKAERAEKLELVLRANGPLALSAFRWPRDVGPLPRLRTVQLELVGGVPAFAKECPPLESLLGAHEALQGVRLFGTGLTSLLAACPPQLRVVAAHGSCGIREQLQRFPHLRELRVEGVRAVALPEVEAMLQTSLRSLEALTLRSAVPIPGAVGALRAAGCLGALTQLNLAAPDAASLGALGDALGGLPLLRQLTVRPAPPAAALDAIRAASMPSLVALLVLGDPCRPLQRGSAGPPECRQLALRRLVRRAPQALHALSRECTCRGRAKPRDRPLTCLLARHRAPYDLWVCTQCDELRAKAKHAITGTDVRYVCVEGRA